MEQITLAIQLAVEKYREEILGGDAIEDGTSFVTIFNNCCLYISIENGKFKNEFMGDIPIKIDMTLDAYSESEE